MFEWLDDIIDDINDIADDIGDNINDWIDDTVDDVGGWIDDTVDDIGGWIDDRVDDVNVWIDGLLDDIIPPIDDAIDDVTGWIDDTVDDAGDIIDDVIDDVDDAINDGKDKVVEEVEKVAGIIQNIIYNIELALGVAFDGAMAAITALPVMGLGFIASMNEAIGDFKTSNPISLLTGLLTDAPKVLAELKGLEEPVEGSIDTPYRKARVKFLSQIGQIIGSPLGFAPAVMDFYGPGIGVINRHDAAQMYQPEILPPATLVEAKRRSLLEPKPFTHDMNRLGFSDSKSELLLALYTKLLDINTLRELKLRGHIDEERVVSELEAQGYPVDDIPKIMELFNIIPGIQDLILMAVREAFSPEIAERFGQYQDYPPELTEWAGKQGLTEEWAKRYWASHWGLPGAQLGFEMLHRGIISMTDLKLLLRAQDVMPFWRDKMVSVAYTPYTRVDVRRMHKAGVLDDEAVFTAYADVGFSPFADGHEHASVSEAYNCEVCRIDSKCGRMLDFTIAFNYEPPESEESAADKEKAKERDLTKSDILTGLRDGLLDETVASQALGLLGYDANETGYYLAKVEYQRAQSELNDTIGYLHDAYIKGVITYGEVSDELGKLNLPAKMTDYYLKIWDLEKLARTNKPTKSELMSFLRKGVIDEGTWRVEMSGLGYPGRYIDWYATTV